MGRAKESIHTHLDQLAVAQRICHRSGAFKKCIVCNVYIDQGDPETAKEYSLGLFDDGDEDALFFETEERLITAIEEAQLHTSSECACIGRE